LTYRYVNSLTDPSFMITTTDTEIAIKAYFKWTALQPMLDNLQAASIENHQNEIQRNWINMELRPIISDYVKITIEDKPNRRQLINTASQLVSESLHPVDRLSLLTADNRTKLVDLLANFSKQKLQLYLSPNASDDDYLRITAQLLPIFRMFVQDTDAKNAKSRKPFIEEAEKKANPDTSGPAVVDAVSMLSPVKRQELITRLATIGRDQLIFWLA